MHQQDQGAAEASGHKGVATQRAKGVGTWRELGKLGTELWIGRLTQNWELAHELSILT